MFTFTSFEENLMIQIVLPGILVRMFLALANNLIGYFSKNVKLPIRK